MTNFIKHKRDVFRLTAMLDATERFGVPYDLLSDVQTFAELVHSDMPNGDALRAMGLYGVEAEDVLARLLEVFVQE